MVEHEGDRTSLGQVSAGLGKGRADLAGGAVAIVGQDLDDDGGATRSIAVVTTLLVALCIPAHRFFDGAIDIVLGHVLRAGGDDRRAQARVHGGIGQSQLRRDGDFAREFSEQLGLRRILPPLAVHDVLELGVAGHGVAPRRPGPRKKRDRAKPWTMNETVAPDTTPPVENRLRLPRTPEAATGRKKGRRAASAKVKSTIPKMWGSPLRADHPNARQRCAAPPRSRRRSRPRSRTASLAPAPALNGRPHVYA